MVWGRLLDRQDQLRLLAVNAQAAGVKSAADYEPPSAQLAEILAEEPVDKATSEVARELQVRQFIADTREG